MAYKSPIELSESLQEKWAPKELKDVTSAYATIPESKVYRFTDGDYSGTARVHNTPHESNWYGGRVSNIGLNYQGKHANLSEHKDFVDKLLTYLDAYGLE